MAAQQIPSGNQDMRFGARAAGKHVWQRGFATRSSANPKDLRRNGRGCGQHRYIDPDLIWSPRMNRVGPRHIPVLGREAVEMLSPREGGIYMDATFGAGGYTRAILDVPGTRVIGIDRDRAAIAGGFDLVDSSGGRLTLVEDRFS